LPATAGSILTGSELAVMVAESEYHMTAELRRPMVALIALNLSLPFVLDFHTRCMVFVN
jgi:hypothetical protein